MWGPLTTIAAKGVAVIARGHRGGTHDAVLGPLIFGGLALTATWHPTTTLALLALITGITLKGCAFVVPGKNKSTIGVNLLLSWTTAAWITHHSSGPPVWLPVAVAGGCLIHIIGDTLTTGGYPIPGTWLTARPRRYSLNLFATGAWPERWLLTPALTLTAIIFTARNITASDPVALIELLGVPA